MTDNSTLSNIEIMPALLNISQTCKILNISKSSFYRIAASGKLGPLPVRLCSKTLYSRIELEAWIKDGCRKSRKQWQEIKSTVLKAV
jgi:predicted DNA-binding transcriptional regulator AlpA